MTQYPYQSSVYIVVMIVFKQTIMADPERKLIKFQVLVLHHLKQWFLIIAIDQSIIHMFMVIVVF